MGAFVYNENSRQKLPNNPANAQVPSWNDTLKRWVAVSQSSGDVTAGGDNTFTAENIFTNIPYYQSATIENRFVLQGNFDSSIASLNNRIDNCVDLSTNQTIGGAKTFSQIIAASVGLQLTANSAPTGAAGRVSIFADTSNRLSWRNGTGFTRTIDATSATANRIYTLPDFDITIAGTNFAQTFTAVQSINLANSTGLTDFTINPTVKTSGNLFQVSINGSSRATISNTGVLTINSHLNSSGDIVTSSTTGQFKISDTKLGRGGADGVFVMLNNAENGFGRLCFGGTTNAFSAIKSSGTTVDFRLADDTGYSSIRAALIQAFSTVRLAASTTTTASLNIPTGVAITAPNNGDMWLEADGTLYIRIGGVSKRFTLA